MCATWYEIVNARADGGADWSKAERVYMANNAEHAVALWAERSQLAGEARVCVRLAGDVGLMLPRHASYMTVRPVSERKWKVS